MNYLLWCDHLMKQTKCFLEFSSWPKGLAVGQAAVDADFQILKSWQCDKVMIGICFDTTASNTGGRNGFACFLSKLSDETCCGHHMFKVLLSDSFRVCLGPSSESEIIFWRRFRERWTELNHHQVEQKQPPFILVSESRKTFILQHSQF